MRKRLSLYYLLFVSWALHAGSIDLLERYPTKLTTGDTAPDHAREWEFGAADIFRVTGFNLEVGPGLRVEVGEGDLGIGHCADGAVWAVLLPRGEGRLTSSAAPAPELLRHVWLRFHPQEITRLFPKDKVSLDANPQLVPEMQAIARVKMGSSWQAGRRAMIPEPKDMTVDIDTQGGSRRFFVVDREAGTAQYVPAFEKRAVRRPPQFAEDLAKTSFDQLWEAYDREYPLFMMRPEVDWAKLRDQYRPRALQTKTAYEFASICANMLRPLRDLHVWMDVAGAPVEVFNRVRVANANPRAWPRVVGALTRTGRAVEWAKTPDRIGYIVVHQWNDDAIPRQVDEILEQMRDTRGLVIDVRLNGGGSEPQAEKVAGRFLEREFVYAFSQYRNGPQHTELGEKIARRAQPRGPWRYARPVVLLIGQKCMSSNESFVAMMSGAPQVTIMGDHTCGSSGNPRMLHLPLDITVSLPRWIDYLPDGTPLDERGFQPQVQFPAQPGAFENDRDDLLTAALERLRQTPLPDKPIDGPPLGPAESSQTGGPRGFLSPQPDYTEFVKEEAQDPQRAKVIAVFPSEGAENVGPITEIRLRFDRPMDPLSLKLDWESGGIISCEFPNYDADRHEFTIPVVLVAGTAHRVVLNKSSVVRDLRESRRQFPQEGFQSAEHQLAGLFVWRFHSKAAPVSSNSPVPKVTSISPAAGSQVPLLCLVELQFDQPMLSLAEALPYLVLDSIGEGPALVQRIEFDPDQRRFRLPIVMPAGKKAGFTLAGFRSAKGVPAQPLRLDYQATDTNYSAGFLEHRKQAGQDPRLLDLLKTMQQRRAQLNSLSERVQSLYLSGSRGAFDRLWSSRSTFRWQRPNTFLGDAGSAMTACAAFAVGCDGQTAWWHYKGAKNEKLILCPVTDVQNLNLSICDPFGLTSRTVPTVVEELGLSHAGTATRLGQKCHGVEAWTVATYGKSMTSGKLTQWWIHDQDLRPIEVDQFWGDFSARYRFLYDAVNEPLPDSACAVPTIKDLKPSPPDELDADYTARFINARDGADGRMSVRWGKQGPKGMSSSGLN